MWLYPYELLGFTVLDIVCLLHMSVMELILSVETRAPYTAALCAATPWPPFTLFMPALRLLNPRKLLMTFRSGIGVICVANSGQVMTTVKEE